MSALSLTAHAQRRMQQRGLREADLERVLELGRMHYQAGGAIVYIERRARVWLGPGEEHLASVYLVMQRGGDGAIVTVGHRTRNLKLH